MTFYFSGTWDFGGGRAAVSATSSRRPLAWRTAKRPAPAFRQGEDRGWCLGVAIRKQPSRARSENRKATLCVALDRSISLEIPQTARSSAGGAGRRKHAHNPKASPRN